MLTETRKSDRVAMASKIYDLCKAKGAKVSIYPEPSIWGDRATMIHLETVKGLSLSISLDGDICRPNTHVLSWHFTHPCQAKLAPTFAPSVNTCHFHKATDIAEGFDELLEVLGARLASANAGTAFQPEEVPNPTKGA